VIVTGDLTQRAKEAEFRHAASFLEKLSKLGASIVVIPGNHDVSLYNPIKRFLRPFRAYDEHIGSRFPDSYEDESVCVVGLRTNDVRTVAEGRLRRQHAELCRERFGAARGKLKLLAVHHPLLESLSNPYAREILGTAPEMVLSGHRHRYGIVKMQADKHSVLSLSAGTAISTRTRDEENGFNWIEYSPSEGRGEVRSLLLKNGQFQLQSEENFSLPPLSSGAAKEAGAAPGARHGSSIKASPPGPLRVLPGEEPGPSASKSKGEQNGRKNSEKAPREISQSSEGEGKKERKKRA
jgi:hypothetical protein